MKNRAGEVVLEANDAAPILLADLSPGRYAIEATYEDQTLTRNVAVADSGTAKVVFQWKVPGIESEQGGAETGS